MVAAEEGSAVGRLVAAAEQGSAVRRLFAVVLAAAEWLVVAPFVSAN